MLTLAGLTVALAVPPSLLEPARSGSASPNDAALVVGIEDFAFLPDVPYARRDVQAMVDVLVNTRGVPAERVVSLDGASLEQLRNGLARARSALGPGGTLWVYFAGHGAASPETGRLLLVGDDAKPDPDVFSVRSLPVEELLGALPDGAVVLLDTCWGGAARSGEALVPGARFAVPAYAALPPRVTVWTAASPTQTSGAYGPAQHGAFTYFVAGALRGWADGALTGEADGRVDLAEAEAYVNRALSAVGVLAQTPRLEGPRPEGLVAGALEAGPPLGELPRQGSLVAPALGPSGFMLAQEGFGAPLRWLDKTQFADANGRVVPQEQLLAALQSDVPSRDAYKRYTHAHAAGNAGVVLISLGATAALLSGLVVAATEDDPPGFVTLGVGAAAVAGGTGMVVGTKGKRARAREELLEYLNGRMADENGCCVPAIRGLATSGDRRPASTGCARNAYPSSGWRRRRCPMPPRHP